MKFAFLFLTILFSQVSVAQNSILGSWKGVMYRDGYDEKDAFLFYLDLVGSGSEITGKTRNEIYMTDLYAVKKIKGSFDKNIVLVVLSVCYFSSTQSSLTQVINQFFLLRSKIIDTGRIIF